MPTWVAIILSLSLFSVVGFADSEIMSSAEPELSEPMCRQKAKDLAKKRYDLCMKKVKQAEIKKLHQQYQKRIESIKQEYQDEIKKLKGGESPSDEVKEGSQKPAPRMKRKRRRHKVAQGL